MSTERDQANREAAQALTAEDLEEIRRRRNTDRSGDLTTAEFSSRLKMTVFGSLDDLAGRETDRSQDVTTAQWLERLRSIESE